MSRHGPQAPYVSTVEELNEIVLAVKAAGAFSFDVETRGNIHRHADVMALIETEWQEKLESLKSTNENVIARSRQAIEDRWTKELALDTLRNEVFWLGIGTEDGQSWAIPMGHPNGEVLIKEVRGDGSTVPPPGYRAILASGKESQAKAKYFIPAVFSEPPQQLTQGEVFSALETIFMDPSIDKVNHNIKFDAKSLSKYYGGKLPEGQFIDTMVLMHIMNENLISYTLGNVIDEVFKYDPYAKDGKLGATIEWEPFSKACRYVHYDARWAWMVYQKLWRRIARDQRLFHALNIDLPCIRTVAQMELNGIPVNTRELSKVGKELDIQMQEILRDMSQYAPLGFNPDSPLDKAKLLYSKKSEGGLGLKPKKVSEKTGKPSVDDESLKSLQGKHPMIQLLMDHAEVKKLKSTYIEGMLPLLHKVGTGKYLGRLHPQFHFHRTATGRFSSSDPNLQNIPRDGRIRSLFVALPGDSLVVADYSQIEMRIMAMFSQDPALLHIFENDIDVHTGTATVILGREPVDKEERNIYGKTPNFLMGYGGTARRLVASTNGVITMEQAEFIVKGYDEGYAGLTEWKRRTLAIAKKKGYVETLGGRRRRLPDLAADRSSRDGWKAATRAERQAINAIVQGTAAEICKEAMVRLDNGLRFPDCKMLVQVHDELVTSVPTDELGVWIPFISEAMGHGTILHDGKVDRGVKLIVDAHAAGSWAEAKG